MVLTQVKWELISCQKCQTDKALGLNYVSVEADESEEQSVKFFPYPVIFYHRNVNEFLFLKSFGLTHAVSGRNNLLFDNID